LSTGIASGCSTGFGRQHQPLRLLTPRILVGPQVGMTARSSAERPPAVECLALPLGRPLVSPLAQGEHRWLLFPHNNTRGAGNNAPRQRNQALRVTSTDTPDERRGAAIHTPRRCLLEPGSRIRVSTDRVACFKARKLRLTRLIQN
jgi:hypothetical protein